MARQAGPFYFTGTIGGITFYKMDGEYLARKKSSLDRKRFRTDPRFARSRQSAEKFGEASQLASHIYWQLPKEQRGKGVIGKLTRHVGCLLREGKTVEEIIIVFLKRNQLTRTNSVIESKPNEPSPTQEHRSAWKVTPTGKLIGPKLPPAISAKTPTSFTEAARPASGLARRRE